MPAVVGHGVPPQTIRCPMTSPPFDGRMTRGQRSRVAQLRTAWELIAPQQLSRARGCGRAVRTRGLAAQPEVPLDPPVFLTPDGPALLAALRDAPGCSSTVPAPPARQCPRGRPRCPPAPGAVPAPAQVRGLGGKCKCRADVRRLRPREQK